MRSLNLLAYFIRTDQKIEIRRLIPLPLFLCSFLCNSQVNQTYVNRFTFNTSRSSTTIGKDIFFSISKTKYFELSPSKLSIIKMNDSLNIIDSLDLSGFDRPINNSFTTISRIVPINKDSIVALINQTNIDSTHNGILYWKYISHLLFFDNQLNPFDTISFLSDSVFYNLYNLVESENKWLLLGGATDTINSIDKPFIKEFNRNFQLEKTISYPNLIRNKQPSSFVDIQEVGINYITRIEGSNKYFALLDSNFSLISNYNARDSTEPNFYFSGYGEFVSRIQNPPLYIGAAFREVWGALPVPPYHDNYWYLGIGQIDSSGQIQEIDSLPLSGFNYRIGHANDPYWELFPTLNLMDSRRTDSTIIALAGQTYFFDNYTDSIPNQIYIYNFNANTKQLNWLKIFEPGVATSTIVQSSTLPNNRFLIILNEYDWSLPYENLRVHLMILNGNGDILNEREFTSRGPKFIETYPNPFIDQVHVNLPENDSSQRIHFELIDLFGKTIRSGILGETHTIEALENIPSGSYILHFSTEKGDTWISKVIKE